MADISRRSLFGALAALASEPVITAALTRAGKFGLLTVEEATHRGIRSRVRVFLNGRDVTRVYNIQAADDVSGYLVCLARDRNGGAQPNGRGQLTMCRIDGDVEIRIVDEEPTHG